MTRSRPRRSPAFLLALAIIFIPGITITAALAANQLGYCVNTILPGGSGLNARPYLLDVGPNAATLRLRSTVARDATLTYTAAGEAPVTQSIPSGKIQTAELSNLTPGATYTYTIERAESSWDGTFRTPAGASDSVRFDVLGSSGVASEAQHAIADEMTSDGPNFVLHTGDVVFPRGALCQYGLKYFGPYEELIGNVPVTPAVGEIDLKASSGQAFRETFELPNDAGGERPLYHSFDYGPVHVVVLDSELYGENDRSAIDTQRDWLITDLQATSLPWTVVLIHRPLYSSTAGAASETIRADLGPIFAENEVDLVLSGHARNYERFHPDGDVIYIVTGGGGATLQGFEDNRESVAAASVHHFLSIDASPGSVSVRVVDDKDTVIDSFQLTGPDTSS